MRFKCFFIGLATALQAFGTVLYTDTLGPDGQLVEKAPAADSTSERYWVGRGDADYDGLPDAMERLSTILPIDINYNGTSYKLSPSNAHSIVTATNKIGRSYSDIAVVDYFLPYNGLYFGEMFTDHDMMEDIIEDDPAVRTATGENYTRMTFDPWTDNEPVADGWCKYSELRSYLNSPTNYVGHPTPTIRGQLHYYGEYAISKVTVKAWHGRDASGTPDAVWNDRTVGSDGLLVLGAADSGWLREGANLFVVEAVTASSTSWKPGMPYGVALDVMVGYASAKFELELTETTPITARMDITATYGAGSQSEAVASTDRAQQDTANGFGTTILSQYAGTNGISATKNVRVRVVRNWINGKANATVKDPDLDKSTAAWDNVVLDRVLDLNIHPYLTEADLYADGKFDLDWGESKLAAANVTNAVYRIVLGNDSVGNFDNFANNVAFMFSNVFEKQRTRVDMQDPVMKNVVKAQTPTFKWTHKNALNKPYPAFELRVFKTDGTLVYDSGVRKSPVCDADGVYRWTPPDLHVGEAMNDGVVFENNQVYEWVVDMLDAKFTKPESTDRASFRMNVDSSSGASSDYGMVNVAVKYFGSVPVSTDASSLKKLIRVEAFASPDFAGGPVAATYVKSTADLANPSNAALNAVLTGVPAGTPVYVRAFIDTDGSRTNAFWKTWGYGNFVGTSTNAVYAPQAYTVVPGSVQMPTAVVYLDDADNNNNGVPDALDWDSDENALQNWYGTASDSPYVVTSLASSGTVTSTNTFAWLDAASVNLPFVSAIKNLENGGTLSALEVLYSSSDRAKTGDSKTPVVTIATFSHDTFSVDVGYPTYFSLSNMMYYANSGLNTQLALVLESRVKSTNVWTSASVGTYSIPPAGPSAALRAKMEEDVVTAIRALPNNVQYRVRITY